VKRENEKLPCKTGSAVNEMTIRRRLFFTITDDT
jgi:hypothetical protein